MKKVLLISYFFPPQASTGGIRPMKFVKYLPHFRWLPIVLSCKNPFDFEVKHIDLELLKEIPPEAKVFRTVSFEAFSFFWNLKKSRKNSLCPLGHSLANRKQNNNGKVFIKNLIYDILRTPDIYQGWIPITFLQGLKIIKKEDVRVIIATAPPASALITGYLLSKFTKRPLIIDYRDPWFKKRNIKFFEKLNESIEKKVIAHAKCVISITNMRSEQLQKEYGYTNSHKFVVIPNGYDSDDIKDTGITTSDINGKLTFIHAGKLYSYDGVADFIDSILSIIQENSNLAKVLKILFIGDRPNLPKFDILEKLGVANFKERVSRKECLTLISKAQVLLVFLKNDRANKGCIPSKLFDYMMFRKPVFGIFSAGEASDLIERANLGVIAGYNDRKQIKRIVYNFYKQHKNKNIKNDFNEEFIKKYDRRELTKRLSSICEYIANSN
jgi:glycosyltransferase involved in cell wall biosynthesis